MAWTLSLRLLGLTCNGWSTRLTLSSIGYLYKCTYSTLNYECDGKFTGPMMKTAVPGPISKAMYEEIQKVRISKEVLFFVDYERSRGNYVVDADGNVMLDLYQQIASLPLGYNNSAVIAALREPGALVSLVNRPSLSVHPSLDYVGRLKNSLLSIAPPGLSKVSTMACGTCSNENAIKASFIKFMNKRRNGPADLASPEYKDILLNKGPGCPNLSILSFERGFHGRCLGSLSCSHSKLIHKLDIPAFDWPIAPFPQLRYPLEQHQEENRAEEQRCLQELDSKFLSAQQSECPVAAAIVEPIQGEGGDRHASSEYFKSVQALCKKYGASLIVDEVQTGGGVTGTMWAHESWGLEEPPDYVTFAKKLLSGGFFLRGDETHEAWRITNTWLGDLARLVVLEAVVKEIKKNDLLLLARQSGEVLLSGLRTLEDAYPELIMNARGVGTFCAVDCSDAATRDAIVAASRNKGFHIGGCGNLSIRFRPTLIFQPSHANMFLEGFQQVLKEMLSSF